MDNDDELCPCESGKKFKDCCEREYKQANQARERLKNAMASPEKAKELKELLKQFKQNDN